MSIGKACAFQQHDFNGTFSKKYLAISYTIKTLYFNNILQTLYLKETSLKKNRNEYPLPMDITITTHFQ